MTATIDLFVLKIIPGAEEIPLYEPEWLFVNYADTGGLWKHNKEGELEFQITGVGVIIDALFGNGPERYELTSDRPVVLADYRYRKQKVFPFRFDSRKHQKNRHLVLRTKVMEHVRTLSEKRKYSGFHALSLGKFVTLLKNIPHSDMLYKGESSTTPMNAFLADLDPTERLILPIIGSGLRNEYATCSSSKAMIVDPRYLEK